MGFRHDLMQQRGQSLFLLLPEPPAPLELRVQLQEELLDAGPGVAPGPHVLHGGQVPAAHPDKK